MAKINLRNYYLFYKTDFFIDVSDAVEAVLLEAERLERNHIRRCFYNKAYYSLGGGNGIENDSRCTPPIGESKWKKIWR